MSDVEHLRLAYDNGMIRGFQWGVLSVVAIILFGIILVYGIPYVSRALAARREKVSVGGRTNDYLT